ncbi:uncharacterized protein LOC135159720 [Lytechinus pictus]|uniref:uncharacterized protein LOC129253920 n=1 Tax=Lytechinus pictus TaxID=7653 RepID=UPI0030B9FDB6
MEYFVLVFLAPLTVVCLCCVIMFYYRRSSRLASHSSSLPTSSYSITSDNPPVPVNQSPLIPSHRFSAQHQQERLRKQREMVCSHSESTEKFPTSVCLPDEDEPQHMRDNVRIHREVMTENGIRAPPNRTVYDSERQDLMIQCRSKTENLQRHPVRRSPSNASNGSQSKRGGIGSRAGVGGGYKHGATAVTTTTATLQGGGLEAIDSETRSPLNLVDSDSEGPPPYASLVQTKNNIINVCDDSRVSTSNSTDGLLQCQQPPCTPPCQPNTNGRFNASARGANRGSGVRLKHEGADCV